MPALQSLSETLFIRNYLILLSLHIFLLSLCVIFLVPKIVTFANINNSSTIVQIRFAEASSLLRREVPSSDVSIGPRGPPHQVGPGTNILPLYQAYFCTSLSVWMHHLGYAFFTCSFTWFFFNEINPKMNFKKQFDSSWIYILGVDVFPRNLSFCLCFFPPLVWWPANNPPGRSCDSNLGMSFLPSIISTKHVIMLIQS